MTDYVLTGLVKRRAELAVKLRTLQNEVRQAQTDIAALDCVIRQLDPTYQPGTLQPRFQRRPGMAETVSSSRIILDVLRRSEGPLSILDITQQLLTENGLDASDTRLRRDLRKRVGMTLRYQRMNGVVREAEGPEQFGLWEVAQD